MRGRKTKTGPISERTKRQGGDFNGNNVKDINQMKLAHLEGILPEQDQKSGEEAAENDGAPEQLPLEINKWTCL